MYLVLGMLGVILVLVVEYVLGIAANFTIMQYMILELPVGAYFIGVILGAFLAKGVKISGKKLNIIHYITALMLALSVFYGTQYQWYKTTYIHENGDIDGIAENGIHVDDFEYVDEDLNPVKMNLRTYLYAGFDFENENTSYENKRMVLEFDYKAYFPEFAFQVLSVLLTTVITLISMTRRYQYCENCKKYYKKKKLFDISQTNIDSELSEFRSRISNKQGIEEFVNKPRQIPKGTTFYRTELEYCTSCNTGHIIVKELEKHSLKTNEIVENRKTIDIDRESIEQIV